MCERGVHYLIRIADRTIQPVGVRNQNILTKREILLHRVKDAEIASIRLTPGLLSPKRVTMGLVVCAP